MQEQPRTGDGLGRWIPHPPVVPGVYLYCAHQGSPVSRLLVEWWYEKLAARPIDGDQSVPVQRMIGWWFLEDAVTSSKQVMEADGAGVEVMELEWLP